MRRAYCLLLLLLLVINSGCQASSTTSNNNIKKIDVKKNNGVLMILSKDISDSLALNCTVKEDNISFSQDNIKLEMKYDSPYVFKDGYIMYVMESPPAELNTGKIYVPISFASNYLHVKVINRNNGYYIDISDFSLYNVVNFLPSEVLGAIEDQNYPYGNKIRITVELPRSMNIDIPNINVNKVIAVTPLADLPLAYRNELLAHGLIEKDADNYSEEDYRSIKGSWKLEKGTIEWLKNSYSPDLKDKDLSNWTYRDYYQYMTVTDKQNAENSLTNAAKEQLRLRGITLSDAHYLSKDNYDFNNLHAYSDSELRESIKGYYQFSIDWLKANSKYEKTKK